MDKILIQPVRDQKQFKVQQASRRKHYQAKILKTLKDGEIGVTDAAAGLVDVLASPSEERAPAVGFLVAEMIKNKVIIGWSKCRKGEKFNREEGVRNARARIFLPEDLQPVGIMPQIVIKAIPAFKERAAKYFRSPVEEMEVRGFEDSADYHSIMRAAHKETKRLKAASKVQHRVEAGRDRKPEYLPIDNGPLSAGAPPIKG